MLLQNWIIPLLYSDEFTTITSYTTWAMPGVMFKAVSWALGFILLAKGEGKLFLITELISDVTSILINIMLYKYIGLEGLGIAYTINFIIYTVYMWIISVRRYNFKPEKAFYTIFVISLILLFAQAILIKLQIANLYIISSLALSSTLLSLVMLILKVKTKTE